MQDSVVACFGQIIPNKGCNGQQPVSTRSVSFVLTKAGCVLSGRLRILVRGCALSALKSGVNVHLHDNSYILSLDVSPLSIFHRLVIMVSRLL